MKIDEQVIFWETTTVRLMIIMADGDRGGARGMGSVTLMVGGDLHWEEEEEINAMPAGLWRSFNTERQRAIGSSVEMVR